MKWLVIISLIILIFAISSCTHIEECKKPFISSEGQCCLDLDEDGACDENQQKKTEEPAKVEEKQVSVEEKEIIEPKTEVKEEMQETKESEQALSEEKNAEPEENETTLADQANETKVIYAVPKTAFEKILATFSQNVTSYKYIYNGDWYYVRGDKIRIKLHDAALLTRVNLGGKYYPLFYYDNVYLDKKEKFAVGYCEGTDLRLGSQCQTLKITDLQYPVSYEQYKTKLPEEWLFEYLNKKPFEIGESKYYVSGRKTTKFIFKDEDTGIETIIYFDLITGLPIKVDILQGERIVNSYIYNYLSANTVRNEDVIHRKAAEIPASESFYSIYSQR